MQESQGAAECDPAAEASIPPGGWIQASHAGDTADQHLGDIGHFPAKPLARLRGIHLSNPRGGMLLPCPRCAQSPAPASEQSEASHLHIS